MAGMDLSLRRSDRGISVFWMILALGAGVFAILAILLVTTADDTAEGEYDSSPEIIVNEGDTTYNAIGNTGAAANEVDPSFTGGTVTVGGPTEEGDNPTEAVEVEVTPGDPVAGTVVEPSERGTDADMDGGDAAAQADAGGQEDIVVDPDGTTSPVDPTPSGPAGSDGNALTQD